MDGVLEILRAWIFPSCCVACDAPGAALCVACAPGPRDVQRFAVDGIPGVALGSYDGALRRAVVAMKRGERDPVDAFAALFDGMPLEGVLVPLPTTRHRVAARGFDQGVMLARRLAARRGLACSELLVKRGRAQEGRNRRDRLAAVGRFGLRPGIVLPDAVTLVDDVCTTGATLRDAAGTLRAAGVDVLGAAVVARAAAEPRGLAGGPGDR